MATEMGLRPRLGRGHLAPGRGLVRAGGPDSGREHLEQAAALFRDMGMRFSLERAETSRGRSRP
jgi:hypothetical protein